MKRWMTVGVVGLTLMMGCALSPYRQAETHLSNKEYDEAIRAYVQMLKPHVKNGKRFIVFEPEAVKGIGVALCYKQQYKSAAKVLNMVLNRDPDDEMALFYLGASYEGLNQFGKAQETYGRYAMLDMDNTYRDMMKWRLSYLVRRRIAYEIKQSVANENRISAESISPNSIAVLYFYNLTNNERWTPLQKGLAEMMITDLAQVPQFNVVERVKLQKLMEEMNLGQTGLLDDESAPRFGKLLGARTLVKGSYMILPNMNLEMSSGAIDILDRNIPDLQNYDGTLDQLFALEKQVVLQTVSEMGVTLSAELRNAIMQTPTKNLKAFLNYCYGLDAMDLGDFSAAQHYFEEALKLDINFNMARDLIATPEVIQATQVSSVAEMNQLAANMTLPEATGTAGEGGRPRRKPRRPRQGAVNPMDRLQQMGQYMDAGLLPGTDSRQSYDEYQVVQGHLPDAPLPPFAPTRWYLPPPPNPPYLP